MKKEIDTLTNLAYIYMNYGKTKRAIDYLLIAYRLAPHNIQVKKMKIVAFKDIGAFSQALEIIKDLESNYTLTQEDKITLLLMKSFCLKGLDRIEEGRAQFNVYIKERKKSAQKDFFKKYKAKLLKNAKNGTNIAGKDNNTQAYIKNDINKFIDI